jgi:hypothetical protein
MNKEKQKLFVSGHGSSCLCDECMALHFEAEPAENRNKRFTAAFGKGSLVNVDTT